MAPSSPPSRRAASTGRARFSPLLNTLIVAGGYLLSRVLGLVRDVIISAQFGTLPEYGAYRATFSIIDLIYIVVAGGALGSAFIPVFAGFLSEEREEDAWRLASAVLNLAIVGLLAACLLIGLLAGPIVALTIGRGFSPSASGAAPPVEIRVVSTPAALALARSAPTVSSSFGMRSNIGNL